MVSHPSAQVLFSLDRVRPRDVPHLPLIGRLSSTSSSRKRVRGRVTGCSPGRHFLSTSLRGPPLSSGRTVPSAVPSSLLVPESPLASKPIRPFFSKQVRRSRTGPSFWTRPEDYNLLAVVFHQEIPFSRVVASRRTEKSSPFELFFCR